MGMATTLSNAVNRTLVALATNTWTPLAFRLVRGLLAGDTA